MAHSIVNKLGQRMEAKLEHDLSSVRLDSPDSDSQQRSNLLIRLSLGQEADDFNLARSRSGTCPLPLLMLASRLEKSFQHDFGYFRSEETLTRSNGFHGFREAVREIGFQNVPVSPGIQCTAHHLVRLVHREHKNFGIRNCLPDLTYYLDSIQFGHADIDYGHIRFQFYCLFYRLTAIRRLADDSPAVSGVEDRPCTTPHQPVIVSYQNAKFFHVRSPPRGIVTRTVVP